LTIVIVPATLQTVGADQTWEVPVEDVIVPSPLLALQPGVVACAGLDKESARPTVPAAVAMNSVALVRAQMPTDTSTPLILVRR
jgi:hypothetical protein